MINPIKKHFFRVIEIEQTNSKYLERSNISNRNCIRLSSIQVIER